MWKNNNYSTNSVFRLSQSVKSGAGFTLIEILVVIGILVILSTLGLLVTMDFYRSYAFNSEREIVVAALQKARSQSMANINQAGHGVHIDSKDRYVIFEGDPYDLDSSLNQILPADPSIESTGVLEVKFEQLSGKVITGVGTIHLSDGKRDADITINSEGGIKW